MPAPDRGSPAERLDADLASAVEDVAAHRRLRAERGDTPAVLRGLSRGLERVGVLRVRLRARHGARAPLTEALQLSRLRRALHGDALDALADHHRSAVRLGWLLEQLGDRSAALALHREALAADRALRELHGPPWSSGEDAELLAAIDRLGTGGGA